MPYLKPSEQLQKEIDHRVKEKPYFFVGIDINARNTTSYVTNMSPDEVVRYLTFALKHYTDKNNQINITKP